MTALLLTSSSRAKSLMRIFSNVFSFQLPVFSFQLVPSTGTEQNQIFTSRHPSALRRARGLLTSKSHLLAERSLPHQQRRPRVLVRCRRARAHSLPSPL